MDIKNRLNNINKIVRKTAALLIVGAVCISDVFCVNASSLDEAVKKQNELESSLSQAKELVSSLESSKYTTENKIKVLDDEIENLNAQEKEIEKELDSINSDIIKTQDDIDVAMEALDLQYSAMCERIVYTYENGQMNYLELIFSSKDFATFLNSIEYVFQMAEYDRMRLDEYQDNVNEIKRMKGILEVDRESARSKSKELVEKQDATRLLSEAKSNELDGINEDLVDAKEIEAQYQKEVEAQNEVLSQIQAAIAAEQAEAARQLAQAQAQAQAAEEAKKEETKQPEEKTEENVQKPDETDSEDNTNESEPEESEETAETTQEPTPSPAPTPSPPANNTTGFCWPCPSSSSISSDYGPRSAPTQGASTYHKGIDIRAASGKDIVAVSDGKVLVAQFSNSAGNYVIISHGADSSGRIICSVYMHASKLNVSAGQKVSRGQNIAQVGSTGFSTGPHLHFGVTVNGEYVNPWNYL